MSAVREIRLLGGFKVIADGRPVPDQAWRHRRGADLVKLLALAHNQRLHREQVMEELWPELAPEAASANLRKATFLARQALGAPDSIATEGGTIALRSVEIDVVRFEEAAGIALRSPDSTSCRAAAVLYGGELLPDDLYLPWVQEPRERLRARLLAVLTAGELWEQVLEVDRTDEQAHRALMHRYLEQGNRRGAMRQFERLRETLRSDLGVGPDQASVALYQEILLMDGQEPPTPAEQARLLLAWGLVHLNRQDLAEAERTATQARTIAVEAGLGRELGEASALLGLVAHARGAFPELFRREFVEAVGHPPGLVSYVFDAHLCLAEFSLHSEKGHQAIEPLAKELLAVATEAGSLQGQAITWLMLGEIELLSGDLGQADAALARSVRLHEQAGASSGLALTLVRQAEAALAQNRRWKAGRLLQRAMRIAEEDALAPHLIVRGYGALIQAAADQQRWRKTVDKAELSLAHSDVCEPCSMGFHIAAAVAGARYGDLALARRHLDDSDRIAGMWRGGPWPAAVWEARGALRLAEGDVSQAAALFREAADQFSRYSRTLDVERCRTAAQLASR